MSYNLKTYSSLNEDEKNIFLKFCQDAYFENKHASNNMWNENWKTDQYVTLPSLLNRTDRFNSPNGEFYVLFDNDTIVGCSGIYVSDFSDSVAIAGVRTWIIKTHRNLALNKEYFLPIQKQWAIDRKIKIIALSFNDYNRSIIEIFKRTRLGENSNRVKQREPHHLFFNGLNELPFSVNIQYTEQWIIYENLDSEFIFDWETIKW